MNVCTAVYVLNVWLGKYGIQKDRMDKSAVGHDYQSDLSKHESQTDASKGFGGKLVEVLNMINHIVSI